MKQLFIATLLAFVWLGEPGAQGPPQGAQPRPGPLPGGRVTRPARDPREPVTGTASIRGRVVAADTGAPIRRVNVRAMSGELRESRMTSTDAQGRFELKDLPAGRWEVSANKAGYVSLRFGQRRPFESGRPIELSDGETMARADFALPRGAAITGRILDEFGDPVAGARVMVQRYQSFQGTRRLVPSGMGDSTDDTGAFRVYGLSPGDYYVSATVRDGAFADGSNDTAGYAPTYYPGTGNVAEAQRITLSLGEEQNNVSFALLPTRTVRVMGTAMDSHGKPISNGMVMMVESSETSAGGFMMMSSGGRIRNDGSFTISNVSPGSYTLQVRTGMMGGPMAGGAEGEFASVPVTVGNEDLTGINIVTNKGATATGVLMTAEGSSAKLNTDGLMIAAQPVRFEPGMGGPPNRVESDGTFKLTNLAGRRLIRVPTLPPIWMLKAVLLNGSDITDTPIDFKANDEITGLQVIVTDRVTEVNGKVTDDKGEPTRDYTVVVFPEDSGKWAYPSRYVRAGRADQEGLFKIRALPPEERYLAVAVDYLEEGEGGDPLFLEEMKDRATRFQLGDGEAKALSLKLTVR